MKYIDYVEDNQKDVVNEKCENMRLKLRSKLLEFKSDDDKLEYLKTLEQYDLVGNTLEFAICRGCEINLSKYIYTPLRRHYCENCIKPFKKEKNTVEKLSIDEIKEYKWIKSIDVDCGKYSDIVLLIILHTIYVEIDEMDSIMDSYKGRYYFVIKPDITMEQLNNTGVIDICELPLKKRLYVATILNENMFQKIAELSSDGPEKEKGIHMSSIDVMHSNHPKYSNTKN
jgi:hypothetical protein